jgi:hypothetical protein
VVHPVGAAVGRDGLVGQIQDAIQENGDQGGIDFDLFPRQRVGVKPGAVGGGRLAHGFDQGAGGVILGEGL